MFNAWAISHDFPNTLATFIYASRLIHLPFVPVTGLILQFGTEEYSYEFPVGVVAWDVDSETFTLECGKFDSTSDDFPVAWSFYLPVPRSEPSIEQCPHEDRCDCRLLYDTEALIQFLRDEGWTVETTPARKPNPPAASETMQDLDRPRKDMLE